jgi:hypothetical protein
MFSNGPLAPKTGPKPVLGAKRHNRTNPLYVSGRRSRKNCHVLRTSRILSRSSSAVTSASLIARGDVDDLAARVAEALAVELS